MKMDQNNTRLNAHGGTKSEELTKKFFKNLASDIKMALSNLYKYDFTMFDYDPNSNITDFIS